jgi:hypothetical protein
MGLSVLQLRRYHHRFVLQFFTYMDVLLGVGPKSVAERPRATRSEMQKQQ